MVNFGRQGLTIAATAAVSAAVKASPDLHGYNYRARGFLSVQRQMVKQIILQLAGEFQKIRTTPALHLVHGGILVQACHTLRFLQFQAASNISDLILVNALRLVAVLVNKSEQVFPGGNKMKLNIKHEACCNAPSRYLRI